MPENGQIMCNDHDFRGSVCEYVCDKGFILVGATTALTCTDVSDGVVGWSAEPPKCERKYISEQFRHISGSKFHSFRAAIRICIDHVKNTKSYNSIQLC